MGPDGSLTPIAAGVRQGLELLRAMLAFDKDERLTVDQALAHPFFADKFDGAEVGWRIHVCTCSRAASELATQSASLYFLQPTYVYLVRGK